MHKHVHSMATYPLRVHQFTTQQVGKGGKGNKFSLITQNPIFSMHKHIIESVSLGPRPSHPLLKRKIGKMREERVWSSWYRKICILRNFRGLNLIG